MCYKYVHVATSRCGEVVDVVALDGGGNLGVFAVLCVFAAFAAHRYLSVSPKDLLHWYW